MDLKQVKSATLKVRSPASQGTGYLVAPTKLVTCHHVVESAGDGYDVEVISPEATITARVLRADSEERGRPAGHLADRPDPAACGGRISRVYQLPIFRPSVCGSPLRASRCSGTTCVS